MHCLLAEVTRLHQAALLEATGVQVDDLDCTWKPDGKEIGLPVSSSNLLDSNQCSFELNNSKHESGIILILFCPINVLRLELCHKLGVTCIIEQPSSSLLFRYKPFFRLLRRHGARRVKCALGAFHALTEKPVA